MADLYVCNTCGGVEEHLDTCPCMAPFIARRAREARDKADLEALAELRSHPLVGYVACDLEDGAKRSAGAFGDVMQMVAQLLRGSAKPVEGGGSNGQ